MSTQDPQLPPIEDPALLRRLAMGDEEFRPHVREVYASLPPLIFDEAALARALEYPWSRPRGSFLLRAEGDARPLEELHQEEQAAAHEEFVTARGRRPLLAIGSNGSPATLRAKFAHLPARADREALVLAGTLDGFDVGAAPQPAIYGSLPATLFPSPGAAARTALLWLTPAQFTQLAWSEVNYRLGQLRARFEPDLGADPFEEVFVFVSRFGAFAPDSEPAALAAIPARGRVAPAMSQEQLLDRAAAIVLGAEADAAALVRAVHDDRAGTLELVAERLWPHGVPFDSDRWTPLPPPGLG